MFKQSYKQISYFDFFVLATIITNYLKDRNLPDRTKNGKKMPFLITKILSNYSFQIKNEFKCFEAQYINVSNMFINYCSFGFLDKEELNKIDRNILTRHGLSGKNIKYKYGVTDRCINFIKTFNDANNLPLFDLYNLPPKFVNILCALISVDGDLNKEQIFDILNVNAVALGQAPTLPTSNSYESINKLLDKKLICKKKDDDDKRINYHITTLGRDVLNLILDIDEALRIQEKEEHRTFELNTPYKTILARPLSWG